VADEEVAASVQMFEVARSQRLGEEFPDPVSDERGDFIDGARGPSHPGQGLIERIGDVPACVNKGSIEVEQERRNGGRVHGMTASGGIERQRRLINVRNSSRVLASFLKQPSMALVTVGLFWLCAPRISMQRCLASITTATPRGLTLVLITSANCRVNRSWTWSRCEKALTSLGIFDRPMTFPFGI